MVIASGGIGGNWSTMNNEVNWSCRFHPTEGWHEVGCPHQEWTKEQLLEALIMHKQNAQNLASTFLGVDMAKLIKNKAAGIDL